jgi:hypothetical protein
MLNAAVLEHTRNKMFAGADLGDLKIWQVMDGDRDHSKGAHSGWCCQRDCRVELGCDTGGEGGEEQSRHKDPPPRASDEQGETSGKYARHKFRKSPETGGKTDFLYGS